MYSISLYLKFNSPRIHFTAFSISLSLFHPPLSFFLSLSNPGLSSYLSLSLPSQSPSLSPTHGSLQICFSPTLVSLSSLSFSPIPVSLFLAPLSIFLSIVVYKPPLPHKMQKNNTKTRILKGRCGRLVYV